jgi:hypothetical protein
MEAHRLPVPADVDQDDLITWKAGHQACQPDALRSPDAAIVVLGVKPSPYDRSPFGAAALRNITAPTAWTPTPAATAGAPMGGRAREARRHHRGSKGWARHGRQGTVTDRTPRSTDQRGASTARRGPTREARGATRVVHRAGCRAHRRAAVARTAGTTTRYLSRRNRKASFPASVVSARRMCTKAASASPAKRVTAAGCSRHMPIGPSGWPGGLAQILAGGPFGALARGCAFTSSP